MGGKTIRQDKMLQVVNPLAELIGQISGSNTGSKSLVEFTGQITGRIARSNLSVKFMGQILDQNHRSNSWIKSIGQIAGSNPPAKRGQTRPAAGEPRSTHGHAYAWPENGQGRAGNGQRKSRALWARLVMDWFSVT